jgi:uncharacterized membrane protein
MFFQFIMCTAIFTAGLINFIVQCSQQGACPKFEPVAMLGGAIWCLGNSMAVPIIKTIGLAKGMLVWGMVRAAHRRARARILYMHASCARGSIIADARRSRRAHAPCRSTC